MRKFLTQIRKGGQSIKSLLRRLLSLSIVLVVLLVLALSSVALWQVPKWQVASSEVSDPKDRAELENDARATLAQILGGAFLLFGLYFTWKSLQSTKEGQITERFTRAIDQIGNKDSLEVRLGGIYALERIARDSKKDHRQIMEILTAYVRENAPWLPKENAYKQSNTIDQDQVPTEFLSPKQKQPTENKKPMDKQKPMTDIQAILTIISRRNADYDVKDQYLDLNHTNLQGANLRKADLQEADLIEANLQGAILWEANLQGASLWNVNLQGANLLNANLQEARDLTIEQLSKVKTLYGAKLDPPLMEQIKREYPHLLEKPSWYEEIEGK